MAFDKDTGASAGKKSKRGSSKQINEIREVYSELLHNILKIIIPLLLKVVIVIVCMRFSASLFIPLYYKVFDKLFWRFHLDFQMKILRPYKLIGKCQNQILILMVLFRLQ
jgi:hypothetical protein